MSETINPKEGVEFKSLRYVEVKWLDAASEAAWTSIHDTAIVASPCISRGWVMRQDDLQILLCGTVGFDGDGLVEEVNQIISIPKPMIQSIEDFPKPKRKRVSKKKQSEQGPMILEPLKYAANSCPKT